MPPVMPRYGLEGRIVVVTGAARGIGLALAEAFEGQGALVLRVDRAPLSHDVAPDAAPVEACDLGDDAAVAAFAARVAAAHGRVDVLVNNAGAEHPTPLADPAADAVARWAGLLDNNVTSMVRLTRALLPLMAPGASVINQASIWGHTGVADFSAYSASKHAVIGLTRSLAFELAPRGIRVNAVCPGWIRTGAALRSLATMAVQRGIDVAAMEREIVARQAVPAMLEPADIAGVFLFLASADALSLTGQSISASHGEVML
jgi:NAD(P)-dependent dehydrogenase (short-subunit alcohol dehydrogenase family)